MKLGSTTINKLYLGATEIKRAHIGATEIFDSTGTGEEAFDISAVTGHVASWDADTASKTYSSGSLISTIDGAGTAMDSVSTVDPEYVASAFAGAGGVRANDGSHLLQLADVDTTGGLTIGMVVDPGDFTGTIMCLGAQFQSRFRQSDDGTTWVGIYWDDQQDGTEVSFALTDLPLVIVFRFNSNDDCDVFFNSTTETHNFNPRGTAIGAAIDINLLDRDIAADDGPENVVIGSFFAVASAMSDADIESWVIQKASKYSVTVEGGETPVPSGDFLIGANLAGAEFGTDTIPGTHNVNYHYPDTSTITGFVNAGSTIIRLPFRWERIQRSLGGALDSGELSLLTARVNAITGAGCVCLLDIHNYLRYKIGGTEHLIGGGTVTTTHFNDLWTRLANEFKSNPLVHFDLCNEPNDDTDFPATTTASIMAGAAAAIRATGATNKIHVEGTSWSGAHSWEAAGNAAAFQNFTDDDYVIHVHQYLDADSSGTGSDVSSETIGVERLTWVTSWARAYGHQLFLGEWNGGDTSDGVSSTSRVAKRNMLQYMLDNADVWIGATIWSGGDWWGGDSYHFFVNYDDDRYTELVALVEAHNAG
jgi:aryl-phospho-beta-D-glucosidase BglC (GH1 family)